jgi:hypothetical protein
MAYLTMEAEIDHGRIIPKEPEKLPQTGQALITVLEACRTKPDWAKIQPLLGTLKTDIDVVAWEREIREEWNERERSQWRQK